MRKKCVSTISALFRSIDSHTCSSMIEVVEKLLLSMIEEAWYVEMSSAATDGAKNMVGKYHQVGK